MSRIKIMIVIPPYTYIAKGTLEIAIKYIMRDHNTHFAKESIHHLFILKTASSLCGL